MELGAIEFANNNLNVSTDAFCSFFVWFYHELIDFQAFTIAIDHKSDVKVQIF